MTTQTTPGTRPAARIRLVAVMRRLPQRTNAYTLHAFNPQTELRYRR